MPSLGAGLRDAGPSVTGDARIAKEPAQAGDLSSLAAPKPAYGLNNQALAKAVGSKAVDSVGGKTDGLRADKAADLAADKTAESAADLLAGSGDQAGAVVALDNWLVKPDAAEPAARLAEGLVTVRAKPEKRKNAKERAKAGFANKAGHGQPGLLDAVTAFGQPAGAIGVAASDAQSMAHPKPEKRKNAKERAMARTKAKLAEGGAGEAVVEDGTTPNMTATAKSETTAPVPDETKIGIAIAAETAATGAKTADADKMTDAETAYAKTSGAKSEVETRVNAPADAGVDSMPEVIAVSVANTAPRAMPETPAQVAGKAKTVANTATKTEAKAGAKSVAKVARATPGKAAAKASGKTAAKAKESKAKTTSKDKTKTTVKGQKKPAAKAAVKAKGARA